ncbi:MAG: InlB B-repeat-containing protein, partial [Alphaproteobacteria bacterium]|nr:InlB B-repeat-containing protein [Alphaproteobacteria bacterium]
GFTPTGGTKAIVTSAPWVFSGSGTSVDHCMHYCVDSCAGYMRHDGVEVLALRAAVMNSLPALPATCAANTINIDWNPDNGGEHIKNMCTYEGSIELPTPDPVKPGYTFMGWKLVDGTTAE